jgi:hypothetical protein
MRNASSFVVIAFAIWIIATPTANAQTAEAETLFREGLRLSKEENYEEACEKFEASERLEPRYSTEINLGICRGKLGQFASAWAMYLKAASTAKRANDNKRSAHAKELAAGIADQLVYLTISVPGDAVDDLDELVIKRGKTPIDRALWDQKVPVDPGEYTITAVSPGYKKWSDKVTIKTKNRIIEVPPLEKKASGDGDGDADRGDGDGDGDGDDGGDGDRGSGRGGDRRDRDRVSTPEVGPRKYRTEAITLAVIGTGALVLGTSFGLYGLSLQKKSDELCPEVKCTDSYGVALNKTARTDALVANISWGLGGAALITAGILWWVGKPTATDRVTIAPTIDRDGAGFAIGGQF